MNSILSERTINDKLSMALFLIESGFYIFPVGPDKKPHIKGWPNKASRDEQQIRKWFNGKDAPNIGVVTGKKSGLFCLDVDGEIGKQSLKNFESQYGELSKVCVAETPSGGLHYFFKMPDFELRNSAGKLAPGLDIRGDGGYIVVAPSEVINRDGVVGKYRYLTDTTLINTELQSAPGWLLSLLKAMGDKASKVTPNNVRTYGNSPYGLKALESECELVRSASPGQRNDQLNKSTFALFQLVAGNDLDEKDVEYGLISAALSAGLHVREIEATLKSARSKALSQPRSGKPGHQQSPPRAKNDPALDDNSFLPKPPLHLLPTTIQKMVSELTTVFAGLPEEVPIAALFGLLAGCIGQSREIEVKRSWQVAANQYIALVGGSGLGKSPCFKLILDPLWRADKKRLDKWQLEKLAFDELIEKRRANKEASEHEPLPPLPILEQFIVEDATIESIGNILSENQRGILWYCDELSMLLQNLDRYTNAKGGAKGRLLSSYDRSSWKTSRRDKDKNQYALSATLSILGTIQPKVLRAVFSQFDADTGLLPRFSFILAKRLIPPKMAEEEFSYQSLLREITDHLLQWKMQEVDGQMVPHRIRLSDEAKSFFTSWNNSLTEKTWALSEADRIIVPKTISKAVSLALMLHSLKAALNNDDGLSPVTLETMREGTAFAEWLYHHQKHVWATLGIACQPEQSALDETIIRASLKMENQLKAQEWKMPNDEFCRAVKLIHPEASSVQIGKAATEMGIKSIFIGKNRGKEFSQELLDRFRARFYL